MKEIWMMRTRKVKSTMIRRRSITHPAILEMKMVRQLSEQPESTSTPTSTISSSAMVVAVFFSKHFHSLLKLAPRSWRCSYVNFGSPISEYI